MVGTFDKKWAVPMAETLGKVGTEAAWVVHGADGLDELSTTGSSFVAELRNGDIRTFEVSPEDAGLPRAELKDILGGTPEENAEAIHRLLDGAAGAYRDIVLFNAAAALLVADEVADLSAGVAAAAEAIDSGRAKAALAKLVEITGTEDE